MEQSPNHIITNEQEKGVHLTYLQQSAEVPKEHHGHLVHGQKEAARHDKIGSWSPPYHQVPDFDR
jgi:hypothetical protein